MSVSTASNSAPNGLPENIRLVSNSTPIGRAWGIVIEGNYAYVADGSSGLQILDISDIEAPQVVGSYSNPTKFANDLSISGDYAYLADGYGGLKVIDIADPTQPVLSDIYETPAYSNDVEAIDGYIYLADGFSGLKVFSISDTGQLSQVGAFNTTGYAKGLNVVGDYVYIADSNGNSLQIIDVQSPVTPVQVGSYAASGKVHEVSVVGSYAYIVGADGLEIIDISNPTNPSQVGSYDTPGFANAVSVVGDYAFVADDSAGLQVLNVSDPSNPTFVSTYDTSGRAFGVSVVGNHIYVADDASGVQILAMPKPISVGGIPQENETLTADISKLVDADGLPNSHTFGYQWQQSTDGGITWNDIAGETANTFTPGDEQSSQSVRVQLRYTDQGGTLETVTSEGVAIADVNNAPAIALSHSQVSENVAGAIIGDLTVTDPDAGDTHTLTVSDSRFEVVSGQLKLKDAIALVADETGIVTVKLTATDQGGLSTSESFQIEIIAPPQLQTWDDVFTELSDRDLGLSTVLEAQLRATLANGINAIENVDLTFGTGTASLTYTDTLRFDLGKAFDDATGTAVGSFTLELTETTLTFTQNAGETQVSFDGLLNGEAIDLSITDTGVYAIAYGGTVDAGPLISDLVNQLNSVSMADNFQLGIRDFDITIERENGEVKDFDFNVTEVLLSNPDLNIAEIFGNFGLTLPSWFTLNLPSVDVDFGLNFSVDSLGFNVADFDLSGLFTSLGFAFNPDFFGAVDFNIDLDFSGPELGFNFAIPALPTIDWPSLNIDLPSFMLDVFPDLNKFGLAFGQDFARLTYLDDVSTGDLEALFTDLAAELGTTASLDLPDIDATRPSISIQLVDGEPQYFLELSEVNSSDALALMAEIAGVDLSAAMQARLTDLTTVDLSLSNNGIEIAYPQDITLDLDSIPTLNSPLSFVDTVADAVSDQIKGEIFNHQNPIFSDAALQIQKALDGGIEFEFSGAVHGAPIGLQFIDDGVRLFYDFPDEADFRPFASAGVSALEAFIVDELALSSNDGFEIQGSVNFTQNTDDFSEFISDTLGISEVDFEVLLNTDSATLSSTYAFGTDGLQLFNIDSFSATLFEAGFGLEVGDDAPIFGLDGNLSLKGYDPFQTNEPELTLVGGVTFDKSTVTAGFLIDANSETWVNPFGLQGAEINKLGLQLGFTGSAVDNVGFLGDFRMPVGNEIIDAEAAFITDLTDPDKLAFDLLLNESVNLVDLWTGPVVSLARNSVSDIGLMNDVAKLLEPLNLEVDSHDSDGDGDKDTLIRFVPFAGAEILGETLEQGMEVNARAFIGDTAGTLALDANSDFTAIEGALSISEIDLADIVTLSGVGNSDLDLAVEVTSTKQLVSGDAKLNILGQDVAEAQFEITPTSVEVKDFDLDFFDVISLDVARLSIRLYRK